MVENEIENDRLDNNLNIDALKEKYYAIQNKIKSFIDKKNGLAETLENFRYASKIGDLGEIVDSLENIESYEQKIVKADEYINNIKQNLSSAELSGEKKGVLEEELNELVELQELYKEIDNIEKEQTELYLNVGEYRQEYEAFMEEYENAGKNTDELKPFVIGDISEMTFGEQIEEYKDYTINPKYTPKGKEILDIADELQREEEESTKKGLNNKNINNKKNNKDKKEKKKFFKRVGARIAIMLTAALAIVGYTKHRSLNASADEIPNNGIKKEDTNFKGNKKIKTPLSLRKDVLKDIKNLKDKEVEPLEDITNIEEILDDYDKEHDDNLEDVIDEEMQENDKAQIKLVNKNKSNDPIDVSDLERIDILPEDANPFENKSAGTDNITTDRVIDESTESVVNANEDKDEEYYEDIITDDGTFLGSVSTTKDTKLVMPNIPSNKVQDNDIQNNNISDNKVEDNKTENSKEENNKTENNKVEANKTENKIETNKIEKGTLVEQNGNTTKYTYDEGDPYASSEETFSGISKASDYLNSNSLSDYLKTQTYSNEEQAKNTIKNIKEDNEKSTVENSKESSNKDTKKIENNEKSK